MILNKKRSSSATKQRFHLYDARGDYSKPEVVGLINNETDYEYGTPSLSRNENITLVVSNANKDFLFVKFKWRPEHKKDATGLVCLTTKFQLKVGDNFYEHDELLTYVPVDSITRPGRITQYGSKRSSLKMFINAPFRRVRLVFSGYMTDTASGEKLFVRARFIVSPTSGILDCLTDLASAQVDKHMQMVRVLGEYTIDSRAGRICVFGLHVRDFLDGSTLLSSNCKSIIGWASNGQTFYLGRVNQAEFACACYDLDNGLKEAEKMPEIDWSEINRDTSSFKFELQAQTMSARCFATKIPALPENFFTIEFNGKKGWALIELNATKDSLAEETARSAKFEEYHSELRDGKILSLDFPVDTRTSCIVEIDDASSKQKGIVGSKGASLAQLYAISTTNNFRVSRAIVLARDAHDLILRENQEIMDLINNLEASVGSGASLNEVRQECQALQRLIKETELPRALKAELETHLLISEHYKRSGAYAVRSSSWGEDEEDMSAAGQLETMLSVQGIDAICKAVMRCLASKFSVENVEYKRQHGLHLSLPMAFIVQEMVQCDRAGVMFTCNPTSGNQSQLTITANYGLGESVVSGQADPDTILVEVDESSNKPAVSRIDIGRKKVIMGASSDQYDKARCCLNDDEMLRLARCGRALAHYFQSPQDIEWGYKGGDLFVFQSRPVTSLDSCTEFEILHEADMPMAAEADFSTRANVGEVMPFALTPLTSSFPYRMFNIIGKRIHLALGIHDEVRENATNMTYHSCHAFLSLLGVIFCASDSSRASFVKAMKIGLFGRDVGDQPDITEASTGYPERKNPFVRLSYIWHTRALQLMPMTTLKRAKKRLTSISGHLRKQIIETKSLPTEARLAKLFDLLMWPLRNSADAWEYHVHLVGLTNFANIGLINLLAKYIDDPARLFTSVTKIFVTNRDVISAEIPKRIEKMAQIIRGKGDEETFSSLTTEEAANYIERDKTLNKSFKKFLRLFGHRSYNEIELASKSWRENQEAVIDMLKTNCKTQSLEDPARFVNQKPKTLDQLIDSFKIENMDRKDRILIRYLLGPKCQSAVAGREHTKDMLVLSYDIMREASRALAKEMQLAFRIPDQDLLYYFFLDELQQIVRAPCPSLVVQATRRRNTFKKLFKDLWLFEEIIPGHYITPNHLKPSRELDESLKSAPQLFGSPASSGRAQAKVCLVKSYAELGKVRAGDILVTHSTDIAFSPVFPLVAGIITEVGGLISHGAVIAREYGLPSLLGVPDVVRILQDGEEIILDADKGTIFRLGLLGAQ